MYTATVDKSAQARMMTAVLFVAGIAMMLSAMCCHAAGQSARAPHPVTKLNADKFDTQSGRQRTNVLSYNPLKHTLASGQTIRGIRLSESVFLTQVKEEDGHHSVGVSLMAGDYLYQLGTEQLSVSFLF